MLSLLLSLFADPAHGNFPAKTVKAGGTSRAYRLVVPKSVDLKKPAALFAKHPRNAK